ncbi:MAG: hypothetical protein RJB61_2117 [Actinomycetota bacterium]
MPFAVLDGGLSTALEAMGVTPTGRLWTAQAVIDEPETVVAAHRSAVDAGADVVISASYQASIEGFESAGLSRSAARAALSSTTQLARRSGARLVAASVGPYGACMADGSEYHGRYDVDWDEVRSFHRQRLEVLVDTDADIFAVETIPTIAEASVILEEMRRLTDSPAWMSFACADSGHLVGGEPVAAAALAVADAVQLIGVNCTAPPHVAPLLDAIVDAARLPCVAYPNAGAEWDADSRRWRGIAQPCDLATAAGAWAAAGAVLIGGCCGVGTDAVAALAGARDAGVR